MSISIDVEKTFDKNQHSFILKYSINWNGGKYQMAFRCIIWKNIKYLCEGERLELPEKVNGVRLGRY